MHLKSAKPKVGLHTETETKQKKFKKKIYKKINKNNKLTIHLV